METQVEEKFGIVTGIKILQINLYHYVVPVILSLIAAVCEGISIQILVPTFKGITNADFSFVLKIKIIGPIVSNFADIFNDVGRSNRIIFIALMCLILLSTFIRIAANYWGSYLVSKEALGVTKRLRNRIFKNYLRFGKAFFDKTSIGFLSTIVLYFTDEIKRILFIVNTIIAYVFTLLVFLVIMIIISWKLTIFALLVFPMLHFSVSWIIEKIKRTSNVYAKWRIMQSKGVLESLSCIALIKASHTEAYEYKRFNKLNETVTALIALLILVSVLAFVFLKEKRVNVEELIIFFYLIRRCAPLINALNNFWGTIARSTGAVEKVFYVLSEKNKPFIIEGKAKFKGLKNEIEFKGLNFSYPNRVQVLNNISFKVKAGKMVAFVGPSGAGKTTIINLLLRFYSVPAAKIFIDGVDLREYSLKTYYNEVALVSQDTHLFNDTIGFNLTYGISREVSSEEIREVAKKARLFDFIMNLPKQFETIIGDEGILLSGGEKQRLAIARAIIKNAKILVLDEATSSLDSVTERLIQESLHDLTKGKTSIVIAHRLSTIKNADLILVIEDGRLVEQGNLDELLNKKGRFFCYWEEQKFY